jgi:hypothetical protein
MPTAINKCHRMLRKGGRFIIMTYNAFSYRRFIQAPAASLMLGLRELRGYRGVIGASTERGRAAYDADGSGQGAPHVDWISQRSLRHLCRQFTSFKARTENIDNGPPFRNSRPREQLLKTRWPALFGLDIYATAVK